MNLKPLRAILLIALLTALPALPALAQDTDGDLMPDSYETAFGCLQPNTVDADVDYDADSLTSLVEYTYSPLLNPCLADTDGDALPDGWEYQSLGCGFNPLSWASEKPIEKIGSDLRVTSDPNDSMVPSLSWTGSEFGMSWEDYRDGNYELYFARVSTSGTKIGSDHRVTASNGAGKFSSLVSTGSEFGVSWEDDRDQGYYEIYFARISADGFKIGSDLQVNFITSFNHHPSLSWAGSEYGVSWDDYRDGNTEIYFVRISAAGTKLGSDRRVTYNNNVSAYPSLFWTGLEYGVSWLDLRDGNWEIYFTRISAVGVKIGSDLRVTANGGNSLYPSLFWSGSEYGVSWQDSRNGNNEIYFARVSAAGTKIGSDLRLTNNSGLSENPSLSWTGSEFGVSWQDNSEGNYEIYFAHVSADGIKLGSDFRVTSNGGFSQNPSLSWTGSEYGVSWQDDSDGNLEIYFARLVPT